MPSLNGIQNCLKYNDLILSHLGTVQRSQEVVGRRHPWLTRDRYYLFRPFSGKRAFLPRRVRKGGRNNIEVTLRIRQTH